jgi:hypothetical protein
MADAYATFSAFLFSRSEGFTAADVDTIIQIFVDSIVENVTMNNSQTVQAAFASSISENVTMADNTVTSSWIKIIDTQSPDWTIINNAQ